MNKRTTLSIFLIILCLNIHAQIGRIMINEGNKAVTDYISSMNLTIDFQEQTSPDEALFHVIRPSLYKTATEYLYYIQSSFNIECDVNNYRLNKEWYVMHEKEGPIYCKSIIVKYYYVYVMMALPEGELIFAVRTSEISN